MVSKPHYLLFCDGHNPKSATEGSSTAGSSRGHWRFILEDIESGIRMEVSDAELMQAPERAALLAVVRGLEALEQPSRVTLVTTSRYVARGLQFGLTEWRESDYCWEHFGSVQPIRNADLWRRVDHALHYHQITCRWISGEVSEEGESASKLTVEPLVEVAKPAVEPEKEPVGTARSKGRSKRGQPIAATRIVKTQKSPRNLREGVRQLGNSVREFCRAGRIGLESIGLGTAANRSAGA